MSHQIFARFDPDSPLNVITPRAPGGPDRGVEVVIDMAGDWFVYAGRGRDTAERTKYLCDSLIECGILEFEIFHSF